MFLKKELAVAQDLVVRAGEMALSMRTDLTVRHKPHGLGPVTNADIAIDSFITSELKILFPEDRIISEEGALSPEREIGRERVWFVDPIDGTASYMIGSDDYVVMIGLAIDGMARLGVVYQPSSKKLWSGVIDPDQSKTFADVRIDHHAVSLHITATSRPEHLTLIASRTRRSARQIEMIKRLCPENIVYKSSFGLKAMTITEGGADFYVAWGSRISKWDTCAPAAILKAAGGHISLVDGTPLNFMGSVNHQQPILMTRFQPQADFYADFKNMP